jgi:hypothetical protein
VFRARGLPYAVAAAAVPLNDDDRVRTLRQIDEVGVEGAISPRIDEDQQEMCS